MRITTEKLNELIRHSGETMGGPINEMGVLRIALDLKDARAELKQARADQDHLFSAMEFIRASGHAGSAIIHPAKILDWAREIGWKP